MHPIEWVRPPYHQALVASFLGPWSLLLLEFVTGPKRSVVGSEEIARRDIVGRTTWPDTLQTPLGPSCSQEALSLLMAEGSL